ncbi:universal stress protein UspA [Leifsonia sp. LS1]|uniref:universal stress protein n=1 Tax=unclassified Leifsonia TaxID=2663824 RepID=UPI001CBE2A7E|nr:MULTISPECIES: universal stress protein [unclassified Leifsonia]UAJ80237.1 universal stress protein [Leifsonia sp. ZF2019]GIT81589.1 universal stress protein UspA [Leifsonia sp. LS1]
MTTTTPPRILVGYTATPAGEDALAAAAALAGSTGAQLDVVVVLPMNSRPSIVPNDPGYDALLRDTAEGWLGDARSRIPQAVPSRERVVYGDSLAGGLLTAAEAGRAALIVVGAARDGLLGRFTVGSVAGSLLHASPVPVMLAPQGSRDSAAPLSRVTGMVGTREGADAVLATSARLSGSAHAPLRLVSLLALDLPGVDSAKERVSEHHAAAVLEDARAALPEGVEATASVAPGDSVAHAVSSLDWQPGEVAVVGSSRLAQPSRLFLGTTASTMLRALPVPMIVVPRTTP